MAFNGTATVTLSSSRKASLFWIMLWLVSGPADHAMISGDLTLLSADISPDSRDLLA
jgi:hypothetical protein